MVGTRYEEATNKSDKHHFKKATKRGKQGKSGVIQLEHPKINCDKESTPMNDKNKGVETGKCIPRRVGGQDRELKPTGLLGKLKHVQNIDKNLIQGKLKTNGQMKLQ